MRHLRLLLIIFILGIIEATVLNYLRVFAVKPNLLLALVVMISVFPADLKSTLRFSLVAGALKDIFSVNTFGLNTVLFALWGFLVRQLSRKISLENKFILVLTIFVVLLANSIITKIIFVCLGRVVPLGISLRIALLEPLYTIILSPIILWIIR